MPFHADATLQVESSAYMRMSNQVELELWFSLVFLSLFVVALSITTLNLHLPTVNLKQNVTSLPKQNRENGSSLEARGIAMV